MAIDGTTSPGAPSGGTIFLTRSATLPGGSLAADPRRVSPAAGGRDRRPVRALPTGARPLRPAVRARGLHLAPWLVLLAIVYFANLVGPAAAQPGRRHPARLAHRRHAALPARGGPGRPARAGLRLRGGRRATPRATRAPPTRGRRIFIAHALLVLIAAPRAARQPLRRAAGAARPPSSGRWRGPAAGRARSCRPTSGLVMIPVRARLLRSAARHRLEGLVVLLPAAREPHHPRRRRCCWACCSSRRPACSRTPCTSAASRPGALTWPAVDRRGPGPHERRGMGGDQRPCGDAQPPREPRRSADAGQASRRPRPPRTARPRLPRTTRRGAGAAGARPSRPCGLPGRCAALSPLPATATRRWCSRSRRRA